MAAVEAAQRGDWRACVDGYQRAFKESGGPASTFTNRYFVVSGFTAPLRDGSCAPLKSDFKLLTTLIDDEDEQPEIRMQAALTKGMLKWDSNDRDGRRAILPQVRRHRRRGDGDRARARRARRGHRGRARAAEARLCERGDAVRPDKG